MDYALVREELAELDEYLRLARNIREDQKSHALLSALQQGFERMGAMGAARKAVIFTESRRTQDYLACYFEAHGDNGQSYRSAVAPKALHPPLASTSAGWPNTLAVTG